jgi:hypothetical protein
VGRGQAAAPPPAATGRRTGAKVSAGFTLADDGASGRMINYLINNNIFLLTLLARGLQTLY